MSTRRARKFGSTAEGEVGPALGKTIQRLRKAYNMSLGDLSEQSGVAKSIISQIERNETNPTISTVWRLSRALDTTIDEVLKDEHPEGSFLAHQSKSGVPMLQSEDGLCRLSIFGPLDLVETTQWYDFVAKPGGVLESEPHQPGTVEHLYILAGEIEITCGEDVRMARSGEAIRYRGDRPHRLRNPGTADAHATMILMLRPPAAEERR